MSNGTIKKLNSIYNNGVLINDELATLRRTIKQGLENVVDSNNKLDPDYNKKKYEVGAWKKVEEPKEEDYRPLVRSDLAYIIKKLDVL